VVGNVSLTWLQAVVVLAIWEKDSYGEPLCAQVDLKFEILNKEKSS
jgi:hypothetical protein